MKRSLVRRAMVVTLPAGLVAALVAGLGSQAGAATSHAKSSPVVMAGHQCTVVATRHHSKVVGHAGDVVCAPTGNAVLRASGPGTVLLIAGTGRDKLIGSSSLGAHDVLIGGSGQDTLVAGSSGDDVIDAGSGSDSIDCGTGGATVTVVGASSSDSESSDCGGSNVEDATLQFEGTISSVDSGTPPATLTMSVSDSNDTAQAWLAANPSCSATALVVGLASVPATVEVDGGAPLATGDQVEVEANAPASGCSPAAVSVQAQAAGS